MALRDPYATAGAMSDGSWPSTQSRSPGSRTTSPVGSQDVAIAGDRGHEGAFGEPSRAQLMPRQGGTLGHGDLVGAGCCAERTHPLGRGQELSAIGLDQVRDGQGSHDVAIVVEHGHPRQVRRRNGLEGRVEPAVHRDGRGASVGEAADRCRGLGRLCELSQRDGPLQAAGGVDDGRARHVERRCRAHEPPTRTLTLAARAEEESWRAPSGWWPTAAVRP